MFLPSFAIAIAAILSIPAALARALGRLEAPIQEDRVYDRRL